jgi:endonuclease IV
VVADRIDKLVIPRGVTVYLETPAISPARARYHTAANIVNLLSTINRKNVGITIDFAHLHASGTDIASAADMRAFFDELLESVEPERILIHLNDNANEFACGKDRHELLFKGNIWKDYRHNRQKSGIYEALKYIKKYSIKSVMELEDHDLIRENYNTIEGLLTQ